MSYKSPIEVIWEEQRVSFENDVFRMVQSYDINIDKDELIKALAYDRGQYEKGFADGRAHRDAEIVRCKDCKWYEAKQKGKPWKASRKYCGRTITLNMNPDDFCSRGERRNEVQP